MNPELPDILRHWPRTSRPIEINPTRLQCLINSSLDHHPCLREHRFLEHGADNSNYQLLFDNRSPLLLRIHRAPRSSPQRYRALFHRLDEPTYLANPLAIVSAPVDGEPHTASLRRWVPGVDLHSRLNRPPLLSPSLFQKLGAWIAHYHLHISFEGPALLDDELRPRRRFTSHGDALIDFVQWSISKGPAAATVSPPLKQRLTTTLDRHHSRLRQLPAHSGLVHGDLNLGNILVSNSKSSAPTVQAIIDWDYARSGSVYLDLAVLHRHRQLLPPQSMAALRRGLHCGGIELPDDWRHVAQLFDLQHIVGRLNAPSLGHSHQQSLMRYLDSALDSINSPNASSSLSNNAS